MEKKIVPIEMKWGMIFLIIHLSIDIKAQNDDITLNPAFGCIWLGGSTPGVECTCRDNQEWTINNNVPSYNTFFMKFKNCKKLTFAQNSVEKLNNLRSIQVENIGDLQFEENGLRWYGFNKDYNFDVTNLPSLSISVFQSNITNIGKRAYTGRIREIIFDAVDVLNSQPYSFTDLLQTENIIIRNSKLTKIKPNTFTKFQVVNLELTNVTAEAIPSHMFTGVRIKQLTLINQCNFKTVHSLAFDVSTEQFALNQNKIQLLDAEGFKIIEAANIRIQNNIFSTVNDGAFKGFESYNEKSTFLFESNIISEVSRNALEFSNSAIKINNLHLNTSCECENLQEKYKYPEFYAEIRCLNEGEFMTINEYESGFCSFIEQNTNNIIIASVSGGIFIIIVIVLTIFFWKYWRTGKYERGKAQSNDPVDGKTYRETRFEVTVERKDLLTTDL